MEAIEEVLFPALSLVFLLLGVVLLSSILFSAFNPYEQIAFANAQKLRAAIDETCFRGGQEARLDKFDLPQNVPSFTWIFTILPRWIIRANGDPNYVIYYESFPAGEATGWEVYHDFQNRLIVPLPEGYENRYGYDVQDYVKEVIKKYKEKDTTPINAVVISNIVLSEGFRSDFIFETSGKFQGFSGGSLDDSSDVTINVGGPAPKVESAETRFFSYGKWKEQDDDTKLPTPGNNQFIFSNYLGLTDLEKASIKYMPCGANSLCLKTRSGVYKLPLGYCNDIKSVQLVYQGAGDKDILDNLRVLAEVGIGGALIKFTKFKHIFSQKILLPIIGSITLGHAAETIAKWHVSFKISDFNAVSPCSIQYDPDRDRGITIKKRSCRETDPIDVGDSNLLIDPSYTTCTNVIKYPIYQYDAESGKLSKVGSKYHYACVESIGNKIDDPPDEQFTSADECVQIAVRKIKKSYCWTPNPYKKDSNFWKAIFNADVVRNLAVTFFYHPPIVENTAFFSDTETGAQAVVLTPTETVLKQGEEFFESLDRKWWWGWP